MRSTSATRAISGLPTRGWTTLFAVARGVAFGFIAKKVPREILQKLNLEVWKRMAQEGGE